VNSGLLSQKGLRNGKELIAILAHEIAHVTQRHALKHYLSHHLSQVFLSAVISFFFGGSDLIESIRLGVVETASGYLGLSYSRRYVKDDGFFFPHFFA